MSVGDNEPPPFTDAEIVAAINDGDDLAFDTMTEYYRPILVKNAKGYRGHSEDEAEDIVQAIFNRLWEKHDTWQTDNVSNYLHAAVRNKVIDLNRSQTRIDNISAELSHDPASIFSSDSADRSALEDDFRKAFDQAVKSLSERDKAVYTLFTEENLTTDQIGVRLNISVDRVRFSLRLIRISIARHLSRCGWSEALNQLEESGVPSRGLF